MQNDLHIQDDSGDKRYFTIIPNYILNHSTVYDRDLYIQMKRIAGENGSCWMSIPNLAERMGVSDNRVKKSLKYLIEHGWIEYIGKKLIPTLGGNQYTNEYRIVDLWQKNITHYENVKGGSPNDPPMGKGGSPNDGGVGHQKAKGGSRGDGKEEPLNKNHSKKIEDTHAFLNDDNAFIEKCKTDKLDLTEMKAFRAYWTETNSRGKQRWQAEQFFDLNRRIATWMSRTNSFTSKNEVKSYSFGK